MAITTTLNNPGAYPSASFVPASSALADALALDPRIVTAGPVIDGDGPVIDIPYIASDPAAGFVAEAQAITESEAALSNLSVSTKKLGLLTSLSSEAFGGDGSDLITESARRAIVAKADHALLDNPATAGEPTGLSHLGGITTVPAASSQTDGLSTILTGLAKVADLGAAPTAMVMRFASWARLLALTGKDGRGLIQPDAATAATPMLYGVPVVLNPLAPANGILIVDSTQVMCSWSDLKVATSTDALFNQDAVALRITARLGFGVIHPERIGLVTLAES